MVATAFTSAVQLNLLLKYLFRVLDVNTSAIEALILSFDHIQLFIVHLQGKLFAPFIIQFVK